MATPLTADQFVAALRAEGVDVVETDDWRDHNRNHKGAWGPVHGVIIHHTVTSGTASSVELCYDGYDELPGPLCHGVIDKSGTVHLVGNGRANHAGTGDGDVLAAVIGETSLPRPVSNDTDGNARFYGFECVNLGDGDDPWPAGQLDAIERVSAALCRAHGWSSASVIGHKEWTNTKVDPVGFEMGDLRGRVAGRLGSAPDERPEKPTEPDEPTRPAVTTYTVKPGDTLTGIAESHGTTAARLVSLNELTDPDRIHPGDELSVPGPGNDYEPFPGQSFFRAAPKSPVVTAMGRRLVEEGCSAYSQGPGEQWTDADRQSYGAWQRKLGFSGEEADGWPGRVSWDALKVPRVS
ncbi:peptidoglycan-binding protein [Streptomyces sp. UNOB3_S3]|uniref:peptidoglycan-binding protein n=1 Tax=Streptomyces sp. UNOB3_S3 TaxID=2871682 RepID=UPI001E4ECD68|nr:peptidoglycan-binding protein [Streptomyces sp. UNOB3_S3]MCC3776296.1 peptidoglycan-binding protein [Streptomyces sp. UNOB3_S3]